MASSSTAKANLLGKRKAEDGLEKKHKEKSEEKEAAIRKNTLCVSFLSRGTKIADIIDFFKDVGQVVSVQLIVNMNRKLMRSAFVEFASANQAEKALQKKSGEYMLGRKIFLGVAKSSRPEYSTYHKVWYKEDYLAIEEDDETPPDFAEKVLFVANLSPQTKLKNVFGFFKYVGEVVSVRLIVNDEGKHVGYGFVEFAKKKAAEKALEKDGEYLHDHKIFLQLAKTAPYPTRPKNNLAELLCYEDYLRRESLSLEENEAVVLSVGNLSPQTEISHIINFFKDVGQVVHVRLITDNNGKHMGCGFVEFASPNEAKKALEKKNGEYLHDHEIVLDVEIVLDLPKTTQCPPEAKYYIDHHVWYEDYLRQENLLIEEGEAVEGLDETPVFVEEVAVRKKTLFVHNTCHYITINTLKIFFEDVGEVVGVRFIVNHEGKHVGCCFVEFASYIQANKAMQKKNAEKLCGCLIFLDDVEIAPYPLRPKYNLAEKLWYKDYLGQESLVIQEDDFETKPNLKIFCGKKITFSDGD